MKALKKLKLPANLTKSNFKEVAQEIFNLVDGHDDPVMTFIRLKAYIEILEQLKDMLKESAIKEAEIYHKFEREINGVKFDVSASPTRYDYSGDSKWSYLKAQLKDRETMLKGLIEEVADPTTGEIIKPAIPQYGSEILKITFKK